VRLCRRRQPRANGERLGKFRDSTDRIDEWDATFGRGTSCGAVLQEELSQIAVGREELEDGPEVLWRPPLDGAEGLPHQPPAQHRVASGTVGSVRSAQFLLGVEAER
jgi:hypothetical protein